MKLCIRAHDMGVKGTANIVSCLKELRIDGIQLVCYTSSPSGGIRPANQSFGSHAKNSVAIATRRRVNTLFILYLLFSEIFGN